MVDGYLTRWGRFLVLKFPFYFVVRCVCMRSLVEPKILKKKCELCSGNFLYVFEQIKFRSSNSLFYFFVPSTIILFSSYVFDISQLSAE